MKKTFYRIALVVCIAVFLFSAYKVGTYLMEQRASTTGFNQLREQLAEAETQVDDEPVSPRMLSLLELYALNNAFVGWIAIDGTAIDYPVMQSSQEDPEYYLHRTFERETNSHGTPFASAFCDISPPSDNITIYGHHMKDGSMFASLVNYTDQSYFNEHPIIVFDTIYELGDYEIISAFKTQVNTGSATEFKYYDYINFTDEAEFTEFYSKIKELSLYDTGVQAVYGDQFVTLSTCEYTSTNGRMVIVARKIVE